MNTPRAALILAGGGGTRLWPLSRPERPKPFIPDFPRQGPSLIEQTLARLQGVVDPKHIFIVSSAQHVQALRKALPGWDQRQLIIEPAARNTAAAIAYGLAWVQEKQGLPPLWSILPADHCVAHPAQFRASLEQGLTLASTTRELVTLGIKATHPSTQFGYIQVAPTEQAGVFRGVSFTEKPERDLAKAWLDGGQHVWNAGMFLGEHQSFVGALQTHCPRLWETALACVRSPASNQASFEALPKEPFDRAVMEKLPSFGVVGLDAGWNDVGQWQRAGQELDRDPQGNGLVQGSGAHSELIDARNCSVWNQDAQVVIVGAEDLSVIVDRGRILIVASGHEDKVQQVSARVQSKGEAETTRD